MLSAQRSNDTYMLGVCSTHALDVRLRLAHRGSLFCARGSAFGPVHASVAHMWLCESNRTVESSVEGQTIFLM